jgi:VanZ family protein
MNPTMRRVWAWAPAVAYMLLIWALSSISIQLRFELVPFQDKGVHFLEYGTLAALLAHAMRNSWEHWRTFSVFALALSCTILWGLIDEIHQAYVPGRSSDVRDVIADALGGMAGACAYVVIREQLRSRARS